MKQSKYLNIRSNTKVLSQVKRIAKQMKVSQRVVVEIALMELEDLLRQYPTVDYRPDLKGFLLRRDSKDINDYEE